MKTGNKMQWLVGMTAGAAMIALAAGCQPDKGIDPNAHGEDFIPPDAERALNEFSVRQAGNAARADATLRAYHFNDRDLNSLGEERLDSMLYRRENGAALVVYIDLPDNDPKTAGRRETVIAFLKDSRLTEDQIELKSGPNPNSNSPARLDPGRRRPRVALECRLLDTAAPTGGK